MIIQACINGARPSDFHSLLPITKDSLVRDAAAAVIAGAAEVHVHPRGPDGKESLAAVDITMSALRQACPGTLIDVSNGAWIEVMKEELARLSASGAYCRIKRP